jgi:hypothetical protein
MRLRAVRSARLCTGTCFTLLGLKARLGLWGTLRLVNAAGCNAASVAHSGAHRNARPTGTITQSPNRIGPFRFSMPLYREASIASRDARWRNVSSVVTSYSVENRLAQSAMAVAAMPRGRAEHAPLLVGSLAAAGRCFLGWHSRRALRPCPDRTPRHNLPVTAAGKRGDAG